MSSGPLEHPIVHLANVSTGFPGRSVLAGVTLHVAPGELVLIEGATGAGKTTLVRLLLGALPVQSGMARVLDVDLERAGSAALTGLRRRIGVVYQQPRFLEQESVLQNVCLPLAIRGETAAQSRAEGTRMLMDANLSQASRKRPLQLSGGEQARLQIARALVHQPLLVLADEPFAHLDPDSAVEAENLLAAAHARGMTILITSHRPTRLAEHARHYRLEKGRLV